MRPRVLVAGIGNIFLGDDAFGVEVVKRLAARPLPDGVAVVDFGIRGFDLAYALLDGYATSILVDALPRGEEPGTLTVIEPDFDELGELQGETIETHGMHPLRVLHLVKALGGRPGRLLVVGCEPAGFASPEDDDWQVGLSAPVEAAIEEAVQIVESLVAEACGVAS
ncbi:MAG: hydrogenase maturation protease [Dehalococcoidia bacterium]